MHTHHTCEQYIISTRDCNHSKVPKELKLDCISKDSAVKIYSDVN